MTDREHEYWAALPADEAVKEFHGRVESYYDFIRTIGLVYLWHRSQRMYYGFDSEGYGHRTSLVSEGGEQGEYSLIQVNQFRNFLQHIHVMTTQNRPAFSPEIANDDVASRAQADVARGVLEYYLSHKGVERAARAAAERCLVKGEGFVWMYWDNEKANNGRANPEHVGATGDVGITDLDPEYVIRDPYHDFDKTQWKIVRNVENKWDLVARFPEKKDQILNIEPRNYIFGSGNDAFRNLDISVVNQDDIDVFYFYHERCPAVPDGRFTMFAGEDVVLYDDILPFGTIPLFRIVHNKLQDTAFGYTPAFDLMGLQHCYDAMFSSELTTYNALGIQNIMVTEGSDIYPEQMREGLNIIEVPQGIEDPRPLQLAAPAPGMTAFRMQIEQAMERVSAVNAVVRGDPQAALGKGSSGSAMALIQNQALQFNSTFQHSYYSLLEDIGAGIFDLLRRFASDQQVALIVGEDEEYKLKYFNVAELGSITRVVVKVGNALENTTQGRFAIIETLAAHGIIKDPRDAFQILDYGKPRSLWKDAEAQNLLIQAENQQLMEGIEEVPVLLTDDHARHIRKHTDEILCNLELRQQPHVISKVLQHITEHIDLLKNTDPSVLMALGQQPLQSQMVAAGIPEQQLQSGQQVQPPVEGQ